MTSREEDIYAAAAMRSLLADESAALQMHLKRASGAVGLQVSAVSRDPAPVLPLLPQWVRLRLDARGYRGDVRAAAREPLPFGDDAFDVVLLRHALEVAPCARSLLQDAARVLAPGGMLLLTGLHPWSLWTPWCWSQRRTAGTLRPRAPLLVGTWLLAEALTTETVRRIGAAWPTEQGASDRSGHAWLGGGYVLVARKRPPAITPLGTDANLVGKVVAPAGAGCTAPAARQAHR